jgi:hypothetical protein
LLVGVHQLGARQAASLVPVMGTQQPVMQSTLVLQPGRHANAPVASKVEQTRPPQQCAVPPQVASSPAH